jgi:hypothetical protein
VHHKADLGVTANWNFFAASHGKGACDGVAAVIKSKARRASLQRVQGDHIDTPKKLFDFCSHEIKGIQLFWHPEAEIAQSVAKYNLCRRFFSTMLSRGHSLLTW